jgi:hypothetical protein
VIALLVIALVVTVTVLVVRPDSDGPSTPPTNGADSEFASAKDTGPVNIITEDPTCDAWGKISRELADTVNGMGWSRRDVGVPASQWTAEQKTLYDSASRAMRTASEKAQNLVGKTPHRVMRELYQQLIAYVNAFTAVVPTYVPENNGLAVAVTNLSSGLAVICSSIAFNSAQAFAPLLPEMPKPSKMQSAEQGATTPFLRDGSPSCGQWESTAMRFADETSPWSAVDPNLSAEQWTPEQRASVDRATKSMSQLATDLQQLGSSSGNPSFEDFAYLASQYWRAAVLAVPEYTSNDSFLSAAGTYLTNAVMVACKAKY